MDTVKDSKSYLQALHRLYDLLKTDSYGATSSIAYNILHENARLVLKNLLDGATQEFYKAHPEMGSQLKFLSPVEEDDCKGAESVTQVQPKRCRVCKKKKVVGVKQSVEAIQSAFSHPKVQSITKTIASGPTNVKSTVERIASAKGIKQTYDHIPTKRIQQNCISAPKKRRPSLNKSNHYTSQSSKSYSSTDSYSSIWNSKDKGMYASASEEDSSTSLRSNDGSKSNSRGSFTSEFYSQSHSSINSGSGVPATSSSHQMRYGHRLRHGVKVKKTGDGANVKKKDGKFKRLKDGLKLVFHLNNHHNNHHHSPSKSKSFISKTYGKNVLQMGKKTPSRNGKLAYKAEVERMVEKKHPAEKHIQGLIKSVLSHVEDASNPKKLVSIAKSHVNKQKKAIKISKLATTTCKAMKFRVGKRNLRIKSLPKFK